MHLHIPSIILTGDALTTLRTLPDQSVQCCVTSPPYWGLRNYGVDSQIGLEPTVEEHIVTLTAVFREVCRVLRDDGTLWVNYGDTYAHDGKWGGSTGGKHALRGQTGIGRRKTTTGLLAKNLIGLPWRLAFALQADGWYLRSDIIWHKPNPMPESVKDRPTRAHEYIFLLSKSERYYYDYEAVMEPAAAFTDHDATGPGYAAPGQTPHRGTRPRPQSARALSFSRTVSEPERPGQMYSQHRPNRNPCPSKGNAKNFRGGGPYTNGQQSHGNKPNPIYTRNRRDVWTVATRGFSGAHFATFPPELIRPCILAGCPAGGVVLDPFFGAGTVGVVCVEEGRSYLGVELNPDYVVMAQQRIEAAEAKALSPLALER